MSALPAHRSSAAQAAQEMVQLEAQVAKMRETLAGLQKDLADVERRLGSAESAQLLEANEQLVMAALHSREEADTAAQALEQLTQSSRLDALTGLPNRAPLLERISWALVSAKRRDSRLALLYVDLSGFRAVNEVLGHAGGDEVLKIAAKRLTACVRESDTVSRYGGDEFVILLPDTSQASDATEVAEKMLAALAMPCRVNEHVLRLTVSVGIAIYPDDGTSAQELIDQADAAMYLAKREGPGSFVFRDVGADARPLISQPSVASLRQPLGRHELSISEQERRLGELREANEGLVMAALDAQERQAAAERAQRKQREFLGVLAHELRSPLAPIRNAASAMSGGRPIEHLLPKMQGIIQRQVVNLARLVDDLLDVSRIDSGKLRLDLALIDIAEIVDAALDVVRPAMDARMQHFGLKMPRSSLRVRGDRGRLEQVLGNLLSNASKYTPPDGAIDLSIEAVGSTLVLTVADSGIGIDAEALPSVFEPFTQDLRAVAFNGEGLGIGLTVVRELVEAHGGTVQASSAGSGLGSRFVVSLPLVPDPQA